MIEEELRKEIDSLREKLKETQQVLLKVQSSVKSLLTELNNMEGVLRRGMPVHPDYVKELIEDFDNSFA